MEQVGIGINVKAEGVDSIRNLAQAVQVLGGDLSDLERKANGQTAAGLGGAVAETGKESGEREEVLEGFVGGKEELAKLTEITQKILDSITKSAQPSSVIAGKNRAEPEKEENNRFAALLKSTFRRFFPQLSGKSSDLVLDAVGSGLGGSGGAAGLMAAVKKLAVPLGAAAVAIKAVSSLVTAGFNMDSRLTAGRAQAFSQYASGDIAGARRSEYESSIGGQLLQSRLLGILTLGITTAINAWKNNELTKDEAFEKMFGAYSGFIPELLNARGRGLGEPSNILADVAENANRYGFDASVGIAVKSALAEYSNASGGLNQSLLFSRQFGVDSTTLAGFYGNAAQYGQGNALDYVGGTLETQGVGRGRFREFLDAFSSIFTSSLSDGVVRSFADISASMNFLSKGGQTWIGEQGARKLGQMDSVLRGAIGIKSDQDAMLYQAIMRDGEDYWSVAQRMEQGMTPENMKAVADQLWAETGGNANDIKHKLMSTFGFSATDTVKLYDMLAQGMVSGNFGRASESWSQLSQTSEEKTLSAVETIKSDVALIAATMTESMPYYYANRFDAEEYEIEAKKQKNRVLNEDKIAAILSAAELKSILDEMNIKYDERGIRNMREQLTEESLTELVEYRNPMNGATSYWESNKKYKKYRNEVKDAKSDDGRIELSEIGELKEYLRQIAANTEHVVVEE